MGGELMKVTQIMSSCSTGYNFAGAYMAAAREQHGQQPIPSKMPTKNEVTVLLNSLIFTLKKLEDVRDTVQQNRIQNERARESGGRNPDDEDMSMHGDGIKPTYAAMHEVKKRRGPRLKTPETLPLRLARGSSRVVPHRRNRVDTPGWRRGPNGARTLCNACGLYYAKLERKRQLDQRSIRPKPADDRK
ncbi:hypothetical protein NEMBOFW57_006259 [Staphylotrichum longicolle]|uniref:GATA-type domain-containing protein n=1 Tax=Staphylotrichum longicolle TaxID=669026 RepID=A0AAD4F1R2_9PEZI|nr:hypothetical protein NEMBOFW57_006259 [Staphylotrichum longicolle]